MRRLAFDLLWRDPRSSVGALERVAGDGVVQQFADAEISDLPNVVYDFDET
jgi:hypothetical protein